MASNLVSTVRNLRHRKARRRRHLAVLEGARLVEEALLSDVVVQGILVTAVARSGETGSRIVAIAEERAITVEIVEVEIFDELADTDSPQGLIAVAEIIPAPLEAIVAGPAVPVLVLDGVQDPGNAGTMIRSAFALGSPGVIMLPGTVDLLNPKVLRSAMGSVFRFPVAAASHEGFAEWCACFGVEVWAGTTAGEDVATVERGRATVALVVGNEGAGLSEETMALVAREISVPLIRGAESLNVGVAAGILLHQLGKRRNG